MALGHEGSAVTLIPRLQVGDWVMVMGLGAKVYLRRVVDGPHLERDENKHATAELWTLDAGTGGTDARGVEDGKDYDRRRLMPHNLVRQVFSAAELRARILSGRCITGDPAAAVELHRQIHHAVASAEATLSLIMFSYPPGTLIGKADLVDAHHMLSELIAAAHEWRALPQRMHCLATSIAWGGVLCAASRDGSRKALIALLQTIRTLLAEGPPSTLEGFRDGWDAGLVAVAGIIDHLMTPHTKETETDGEDRSAVQDGGRSGVADGSRGGAGFN